MPNLVLPAWSTSYLQNLFTTLQALTTYLWLLDIANEMNLALSHSINELYWASNKSTLSILSSDKPLFLTWRATRSLYIEQWSKAAIATTTTATGLSSRIIIEKVGRALEQCYGCFWVSGFLVALGRESRSHLFEWSFIIHYDDDHRCLGLRCA